MNNLRKIILAQKTTTLVVFVWGVATLLWFAIFGFRYNLEGEKYILQADYFLKNNSFKENRFIFYATTIFLIAICKILHLKMAIAIIILLFINLKAFIFFTKALERFLNYKILAILTTTFLVFFFPFQSWTMYLYTENIYYSLILVLIAQLLRTSNITSKNILQTTIILILLIFSRPLAILFIAPILLFYAILANRTQRFYIVLATLFGAIVFNFISQIVFTTTPDWTVQRSFIEENLICDVPTVSSTSNLKLITNNSQLKMLIFYITHNFGHFLPLAFKRLQLFFLNYRNYYSNFHNFYLISTLVPIYAIIIFRFKLIFKFCTKQFFVFTVSSIILIAASIAMQCDDYHNRFFMSLMPLLSIFVAIAVKFTFFDKQQKS